MKKNWFSLLFWGSFFIIAAMNFIACNNGGGSSNTSQPTPYYNQYGTNTYNTYGTQSWYVPNQWQYSQYNCGCMTGYVAVSNPGLGIQQACAPQATGTWSYMVTYNINWAGGPAQNTFPLNTPQVQYNSGAGNGCYGAMAQGCDTRTYSCPGGSVCQPLGGGSVFGICTRM
jgi:hypothetical protein